MNIGRNIIKFIFLAINLFAVGMMLISLYASGTSPEKILLPAYLSLLFPLTIVLNVFFVIFWLLFRKWLALLSLITLIFSYNTCRTVLPVNIKGKAMVTVADSLTFTLMTYNTHANDLMTKHKPDKPNPVIQYMLDKDPDILCIQEFSVRDTEEHLTEKDVLRIFSKYPYRFISYIVETGWSSYGVAVFSKFPLKNSKTLTFDSNQNTSVHVDVEFKGKFFRLYNCHLETNKLTESDVNMANRLRYELDAELIKGTTLHLSKKLGAAYPIRARQADVIASSIDSSPYPVLVVGDFNDVPASYAYTKIRGKLKDAFVERGNGLGWTYNASVFRFRIDHILFDSAFRLLDFKLDNKARHSDHFPLICKMKFE
jgi:endonuclease/exonuclease/phosphatase family metal-dependent hydrolase